MEVIVIEADIYNTLIEKCKELTRRVQKLTEEYTELKSKEWLDNQDVCFILKISKRTLQYYRERGTIPYSQIDRKIYYKREDIDNFIKKNSVNNGL